MQLKSYSKMEYDMADVQFALGITLSRLQMDKAARAVITFMTTRDLSSDSLVEDLLDEREKLRQSILKQHGDKCGFVYAFLDYLWNESVLQIKHKNKTYSNNLVSLASLVNGHTLNEIYESTMNLLFNTPTNELIYQYVFTPLYFESFKTTINQMVHNSYGGKRAFKRGLSQSDYMAILHDYSKCVLHSSCNGSYSPSSGDPDAFLCADPLRVWYPSSKNCEFINILHGEGQDTTISGGSASGDTTALELKGIKDVKYRSNLDFGLTCAEIAAASSLLFSHKNKTIYDIFSHKRDAAIRKKQNEFKKLAKNKYKGINFDFETTTVQVNNGDPDSIMNKLHGRNKICEAMDDAFASGICIEDLQPLYRNLLQITDSLGMKNAQRLFKLPDVATKQLSSNGQMFQTLVNGFKAMYSLIDFINSADNHTNITVESFPIDIFRDDRYLKRFKTFESYIEYYEITKRLIEDVDIDPERSKLLNSGIYDNEKVFDIISSDNVHLDSVIGSLAKKPLSFLTKAVTEVALTKQDGTLVHTIYIFRDDTLNGNSGFDNWYVTNSWREQSYAQRLRLLNQLGNVFLDMISARKCGCTPTGKTYTDANYYCLKSYYYAVEFLDVLESVMSYERNPVTDSTGIYQLQGDNVIKVFDYMNDWLKEWIKSIPNDANEERKSMILKFIQEIKDSYKLRIVGLCYVHDLFFGTEHFKNGTNYDLAFFDLQSLFYVSSIIRSYFNKIRDLASNIFESNKSDDIFLILISIASRKSLFQVPDVISDVSEINFLIDSSCKSYIPKQFISSDSENTDILRKVSKLSNIRLIKAFNTLLSRMKGTLKLFKEIDTSINNKIKIINTGYVYEDSKVQQALIKANQSIMQMSTHDQDAKIARQRLQALAIQFDENNYARYGSRYISINSTNIHKYFYHKYGYVVDYFELGDSTTILSMGQDIIDSIRRMYQLN